MSLISINPADNLEFARYDAMSEHEVGESIKRVAAAQPAWSTASFAKRGACFHRLANMLRDQSDRHAALMTHEMGKPIRGSRAEIEKCAWACGYFADHAEGMLESQIVVSDASKSFVAYRPLGVVFAIMPWNFPYWQVMRCLAPAMMAGNTAVLKHASNVTGCAIAIEGLFRDAGFPDDVFRTLFIDVAGVERVIQHPSVAAVSLTGSTRAGRAVARAAGEALKKCVLELGGSDAFIVLEDADIEAAAEVGVASRIQANGQSCIAAKRFIVVDPVHDQFMDRFVDRMRKVRVGDPMDESTELGPLARMDLRDTLDRQVNESVAAGAKLVLGGEVPSGPGAYYPATVLTQVAPGMPAYSEEVFGPVAAIIRARDEADAIRIANDSDFGLGGAVFTRDLERGERIAREEVMSGACFVNAMTKSDPRLPFGGIKESGFGRELGLHGIHEFVNVKTVYVQ